jgi:acylphosphatase
VPELTRAHVWVSGRVQGVFFRQETYDRARSRGLGGWVRNLPDGRVEAVFEGDPNTVDEMVRWCHGGTDWSTVEDVEVVREDPEGLEAFEIRSGRA